MAKSLNSFFLFFLVLALLYLGLVADPQGAPAGFLDPGEEDGYIAQTISLGNDGDLDLENQPFRSFRSRQTGRIIVPHTLGTSILMLPFYLLGTPAVQLLATISRSTYDPFHSIFFSLICAGMILYFFLSGVILLLVCGRRWGMRAALAGVVLLWWGTFLPFYAFGRPLLAHIPDVFISSLLIWTCLSLMDRAKLRRRDIVLLGLAAGGTVLIRWQNLNLLLFGIAMGIGQVFAGKPMTGRFPRLTYLLLLTGSALGLLFLTQGLAWEYAQGRFLPPPWDWLTPEVIARGGAGFWLDGRIGTDLRNLGHLLWGGDWGLLWSAAPLVAGLAGCLLLSPLRIFRGKGGGFFSRLIMVLVIALPVAVILRIREQGSAFGYRYLSGLIPFAAAGLTALLAGIDKFPLARRAIWILGGLAIAINLLASTPYRRLPETDLNLARTPLGGYSLTNDHYLQGVARAWTVRFPRDRWSLISRGYLGLIRSGQPFPRPERPGKDTAAAVWLYPFASLAMVGGAYLVLRGRLKKRDA